MSLNQKISKISAKGRMWWVFSVIVILFLTTLVVVSGESYNSFSKSLAEKTNNVIVLPIIENPLEFNLGLDLKGGAHLVYKADMSDIEEADRSKALESVRDVIERRVNAFGVSEPLIQSNRTSSGEYRIIAELAGIKDVQEAIDMIGETPILEFKEENREVVNELQNEINKAQQKEVEESNEISNSTEVSTSTDDSNISEDLLDNNLGEDEGIQEIKVEDGTAQADFDIDKMLAEKQEAGELDDMWVTTDLTGKYLKRASVQFNPNDGSPEVSLEFDSEGSDLFAEITERNIGRPVAIFLDGYPISVPNVNEKITGGKAQISGNFTLEEAKDLVTRLNSGALPVPISLESQKTVEASLGAASIEKSLQAGIIGLILVSIFLMIVYRWPGFLSIISLAVYGLSVLAIFKALPVWLAVALIALMIALLFYIFNELKIFTASLAFLFGVFGLLLFFYALKPVTLTVAGIAGFILSLGMAVDANVLIFSRIKEEFRNGKSIKLAIDEGFRKAWPSIRDGNFSTILTCLILMYFGTSTIQGFGTTLFIGIIVSLFSAIVVTRVLMIISNGSFLEKRPWLLGLKKNNKLDK
jgi:protein-export membrane protein SecD